MKMIQTAGLATLLLGTFALAPQARADWDDHSWWWHHHHHPHAVVVVRTEPVVVEHDYYVTHHHSISVDVQIALRRRGYYHGPIDGDIGPGSRAAIRSYQYHNGLPVTGYIDRPLLRSLGL